jgi:hypothetical protein
MLPRSVINDFDSKTADPVPLGHNKLDEQTAQLVAAIRSSPLGTFKLFRAIDEQPEVERSMANQAELAARIQHAKTSNCLIEDQAWTRRTPDPRQRPSRAGTVLIRG